MPKHPYFLRVKEDHQRELVEDYVEEIASLHQEFGEARSSDLAGRFGVSPAAVSKVISRLRRDGLVDARPYRGIFLTDIGQQMAERVAFRHDIVYRTLIQLGVPEETAQGDAEGIEHHCSDETVQSMQQFLAQSSTSNADS